MKGREPITIAICLGSSCKSVGAPEIVENLKKAIRKQKLNIKVSTKITGCHGFCEQGPIVVIRPQKILYTQVKPEDAEDIINAIKTDAVVDRLLFRPEKTEKEPDPKPQKHVMDLEFYKNQTRYLLRRTGEVDPFSIKEYEQTDGFKALRKAIERTPEEIIDILLKANLRGRGGAGFPTGLKWKFLKGADDPDKYVLANADEGDPGSFMDRTLMEGDPFAIIEGMTICAYTTGAKKGYIYVRAEYPEAVRILRNAIRKCYQKGYLGKDILGKKGFDYDLDLFLGAGAFVCGEETALLNSLEGKRGTPRFKPPFPAQSGYLAKPTNINNVKSYAYATHIIREGPESFNRYGTEKSPGTAVLSLTGKVNYTGIVEVPMGTPLRELIYKVGGGVKDGKKLKAVLTGGPAGGAIPERMLDIGIDYESITNAGSIMGSGGVLILDEDDDMVEIANFFMKFCMDESCGQCVPCREGTLRMHEILDRINEGHGEMSDLKKLEKLARHVQRDSLCGLGMAAPNPVLSTLKYFRGEYVKKIMNKGKVKYTITDRCVGCGICAKNCPVKCISGEIKHKHEIDQSKCIKCGACYRVCPVKAIDKTTA